MLLGALHNAEVNMLCWLETAATPALVKWNDTVAVTVVDNFFVDTEASRQEEIPLRGRQPDWPTCDSITWHGRKEYWKNVG